MRNFVTEGIILKKYTRGENDQIITLFSPDFGNIRAMAKGSRKVTSQFLGHLEQLNICSFALYQSPKGYTITQCKSTETFSRIKEDLKKSLLAQLICEIFDKASVSGGEWKELFLLLTSSLLQLANGKKIILTAENFKIKLMLLTGIMPEVKYCASCRQKFAENIPSYINTDYQIICDKCVLKENIYAIIPFNIIKTLHHLRTAKTEELEKIGINGPQLLSLKKITDLFLEHYLNQKINSEEIISRMN
jgi:DNA repair protein RecO (recombination protein O)